MKKLIAAALIAALAAGSVSVPVFAHHSAAMFDNTVRMPLTGTVTRFDYLNPHSWLYMNVMNEDGTITEWGFELSAPPLLRRQGVGPQKWVAGDVINVITNPLRDGRPAGNLVGTIRSDGDTFGNQDDFTGAPSEDMRIEGEADESIGSQG